MKLNDERRKVLTKYLGLCWHEGRMPINCGYRCVKCGDTYVVNRTFDNDADMMALFRKLKDSNEFSNFWHFAVSKDRNAVEFDWLFYDPERFCNLVAEWLEAKK
jgi:hypothetical protein